MIRWLHISDLHLGSDGTATAMLRDELPAFLKKEGLKCDYVFCTGDIRTANAMPNDFTDDMAVFLKQVCDAIGVTTERLFIVPGNHDVNRDVPNRADIIEDAFWSEQHYYDPSEGIIKNDDMMTIMSGENDLIGFLGNVYPADRIDLYGKGGAPHFIIETDNFNILHVDTTLAYTKGHEANGLVVGTKALYDVIKAQNRKKPTILLAHYPYDCLRQGEKKQLSTMLQHNNVRLWLAGHEHDHLLKKEQYLSVLQAGELRKEEKINPSFLIGEYEPATHDCKVKAYIWYQEGWGRYPYVDLDHTPQDEYAFKLEPAEPDVPVETANSLGADVQKIADTASSLANDLSKLVNNPAIRNAQIVLEENSNERKVEPASHIVERKTLVKRCVDDLHAGKLLVLYGSLKIGKSTLAKQIERVVPGASVYDNTTYEQLEEKIDTLLRENRNGKAIIVTSAPLNLNFSGFDASKVCQIEVPLLTLEETIELISTYNPSRDLGVFIWSHSCGHPVLVKTLCDYLSSCNWTVNVSNFSDVLNYSFDNSLPRAISSLMARIIPDKQDRALLNRLLLIKGPFSEEDACGLAGIEPQIDEPRLRLNTLKPNWIMSEGGVLRANPLFNKVWKPDVPQLSLISCHRLLANNIIHKGSALNEHDVLNYIVHSISAGDYDDAGSMYITVMLKIHDGEGIPDKSLLNGLWIDIPTPPEMSLHTRIGIRIIQLTVLTKLKKVQRLYLLNDLAGLVSQCTDKQLLPFFSSVVAMFSWLDGDSKTGLEYYNQYINYKEDGAEMLSLVEDSIPLFDSNIWLFLLQAETAEDYENWFKTFDAKKVVYSHDDAHICDCCYMSINRFVDYHLQKESIEFRLKTLQHIQEQAESQNCVEMTITSIFKQMELLAREKRYSEARGLYDTYFGKYKEYPLAQLLLNGSMANAHYRDTEVANKDAIPYLQGVLEVKNEELIPDVRLHMMQIYSYVIAEENQDAGIAVLEEALKYVDNDKHRVDVYEYYQCAGELSYAYWCAGKREKAVETLSPCVSFVISDLNGGSSKFAKSYLCICDCLVFKYQYDLDNKPLPATQAKPYRGMFTENGLTDFDDLYKEDRIYTTSFQMSAICGNLGLKELSLEWAYKTVDACRNRREVQEFHYIIVLLLPLFVAVYDMDTIRFVITQSCKARALSYQNHPELHRENADYEFVEFQIVPVLMAAMIMKLHGEESGLELIKDVLREYTPVTDAEIIDKTKQLFDRSSYDRSYIDEINKLDVNRFYAVYVCAYLVTAFYSDATYAFSLLISILPTLGDHFEKILRDSTHSIVNRFVADFWKAKILQSPGEFVDYKHLCEKGLPLIDQYNGKCNQANHTMFLVRHHLKNIDNLKQVQEDWLDE